MKHHVVTATSDDMYGIPPDTHIAYCETCTWRTEPTTQAQAQTALQQHTENH